MNAAGKESMGHPPHPDPKARLSGSGPPARSMLAHGPHRRGPSGRGRWWRILLGWLLIVIGVLGLVLPGIQGIVTIAAGVALVGRRSRPIRWAETGVRLFLRRACEWTNPLGKLARWLQTKNRALRRRMRHRRWSRSERKHG